MGASASNHANPFNFHTNVAQQTNYSMTRVVPSFPTTLCRKSHNLTPVPPKPVKKVRFKTEVEKLGPVQDDYLRLTNERRRRNAKSGPVSLVTQEKKVKPFPFPAPAKKCKVNLEKIKVDPDTVISNDGKKCVVRSPKLVCKSSSDPSPNLLSLCGLNQDLKNRIEKMKSGKTEKSVKIPIVKQSSRVESQDRVFTGPRINAVTQGLTTNETSGKDDLKAQDDHDEGMLVKRKKYE